VLSSLGGCAPSQGPAYPVPVGEGSGPASAAEAADPADVGWPRAITAGDLTVTLYQPQVESWDENQIRSRAAVAVQTKESAVPVYGVVWLTARTDVDRETRLVRLDDVQVVKASFPSHADRADEFALAIREHIPTHDVYVALDRLQASLAVTRAESQHATVHVRNDPPRIFVSTEPAVLVLVDGQPALRPTATAGLLRIINTRALLVFAQADGLYYLSIADRWMTSTAMTGPWSLARDTPAPVAVGLDRVKEEASRNKLVDLLDAAGTPISARFADGGTPVVFVSTEPAELIQTSGPPRLASIGGTRLLEVANSSSDVFVDTADQNTYVLLSGRWYRSLSLERGPWTFVSSKDLPHDFAQIPESHPRGTVLASVAGTPESQEALIAEQIPQTATVQRSAAELTVSYDGPPQWTPIETTQLAYATNAALPVIRVSEGKYYAVDNGIWFASESANGPWIAATSVPDAIYAIPPSSPVYNATYVRIYDSTPDVIYEGYTPGYLGSYVSDDDVVVYGSGFVYPCWAGAVWIGSPWTFGFDIGWAPGFYWGFGWGFGVGLGLGLWPGTLFHPWWGPAGWGWGRHDVAVRNFHEANLYRSTWGRAVLDRSSAVRSARGWTPVPSRGPGGIYAGHDGQVYRTTPSGGWERSTGDSWERTTPSRDLGRENEGRQTGGAHYQTFHGGGGSRGGTFHGGSRR
jgi:hypothetical protein